MSDGNRVPCRGKVILKGNYGMLLSVGAGRNTVDPEEVRLVFFIHGQLGCHGVGGHQLASCILGMKPGNDCGDDQQQGGTGNAKLHYLVGQR